MKMILKHLTISYFTVPTIQTKEWPFWTKLKILMMVCCNYVTPSWPKLSFFGDISLCDSTNTLYFKFSNWLCHSYQKIWWSHYYLIIKQKTIIKFFQIKYFSNYLVIVKFLLLNVQMFIIANKNFILSRHRKSSMSDFCIYFFKFIIHF